MPDNPRYDPGRRDRIIDACLDVIAERGVAGTSHRRVAAAAGVPLGSMTYHFAGKDELLRAAFSRFSLASAERVERRMAKAKNPDEARELLLKLVTGEVLSGQRELVLTQELYTLAARNASYRTLTHQWMTRSRAALALHFDASTVPIMDALIEGLILHRALDVDPHHPASAELALRRITRQ